MTKENQQLGGVTTGIYMRYFRATGGYLFVAFVLFSFAADTTSRTMADWYLSGWADRDKSSGFKNLVYYLSILSVSIVFVFVKTLMVAKGGLNSAKSLHDEMLVRVFHAPMSFFDTTPIGRVLNRFSKDQNAIDEQLFMAVFMFLNQAFQAVGTVIVVSSVTPFFVAFLIPLTYVFYYSQQYYLRSSRELQRLESISRSPIYAQLSESLVGLSTIRASKAVDRFIDENNVKIDHNARITHTIQACNRWLAARMEFLCAVTVSMASFFAVIERENVDPGLAGLSIAYALQLTFVFNMLVRQSAEVETQLVSVERVVEYTQLPNEGPYRNDANRPPEHWPQEGAVSIQNLQLRYRPGLDLVLKGISCEIKPREKVGICGRTGAGKSSLVMAFFRLVEFAGGSVIIDGVNISNIGLYDLRSRLSIIPQDPTLFIGTIRSNLDPFEMFSDDKIWSVLERVYLSAFVRSLPEGLHYKVTESGDNLSVGQRQLMCLGRALLRDSRILIMDEATAAVDMETDQLIQKTIREGFKDSTVMTIAHRINTIMDYDKIMVLDAGSVVEFGDPTSLVQDPNSVFHSLVYAHK
eukprot:Phypoly_transcript_05789.p1 GENE.Phypoly_transcript_05789~~Phypoly_transcript_05789.p1  ORF type:complete len:624 (+),score=83.26 Phypoly_transcript_05789:135-1874(+)